LVAWEDERSTGRDIYAQNIQPDGTLGVVMTSIETPKKLDQISVTAKPNPFVNEVSFNILSDQNGEVVVEIFDISGKRMETILKDKVEETATIYVNGLNFPSGFYFYYIRMNDQQRFGKLVKQ
jgi:hypothetical protein